MFCPPHRTESVNTNVICVSFWIDLNLHIYPLLLRMFTHCILTYILLLSHKLGIKMLVFLSSRFFVFAEFRLVGTVRPDWICMRVVSLDKPWKDSTATGLRFFYFWSWKFDKSSKFWAASCINESNHVCMGSNRDLFRRTVLRRCARDVNCSLKWNSTDSLFPKQNYNVLSPKISTFMYLGMIYIFQDPSAYLGAAK